MMIRLIIGVLALTALAVSTRVLASSRDDSFVMDAGHSGAAEVELGRMAVQKSSDADIKNFGQRMIDDHSAANAKLATAAREAGKIAPAEPNASQKATITRLRNMDGEEFDAHFADTMVQDHEKAVKLFRDESATGDVEQLKRFASETLPTLEQHLELARSLKRAQ